MERENTWQELYWGMCQFLVLVGMFLCLRKLLEPSVSLGVLGMAAAVLLAVAGVMSLGKLEKLVACLLFLAFQCFVIAGYQGYMVIGMKAIGNQLLEMVNYHYRTEYLLWYLEAEEPGKSLCFLMLCAILGFLEILVLLTAWGSKRKLASQALIPFLLIAAVLSLGKGPSTAGTILILSGLVAGQVEITGKGAVPLGAAVYISLAIGILFANSPMAGQLLAGSHDSWLKRQLHFEDFMLDTLEQFTNIRLFANAGAQPEYRLENGEPDITGREAFQITLDRRPRENIYLKGFVGGDYENGRWKSVSKQEFSDWAQQQGYSSEEYQQLVREYPYAMVKRDLSLYYSRENKVNLKLRRSTRGYSLVPYFSKIPAGQEQEADGSLSPLKQREFQWQSYLYLEDWIRLLENNMFMMYPEESGIGKTLSTYKSYAYQSYTRLPAEGLERLQLYAIQEEKDMPGITYEIKNFTGEVLTLPVDGMVNAETEKKIRLVQELLWKDTQYSFGLERVPEGEDFAQFFLLDQKKGYCTHYATAGTLLLRMYGIPARYVMGYLVLPSDFKENGDGTYTAAITDERGHAWTEVFQENVGFCPIEMTPPSYGQMLESLTAGQDLKSALEGKEAQTQEDGNEKEHKVKEQKKEESQKEAKKQKEKAEADNGIWGKALAVGRKTAVFLAAFTGAAGLFAAALSYIRKRRMQRRKEVFQQPDRAKAVRAMSHRMARILKALGCQRKEGMGDWEYCACLQDVMPEMEWGPAMEILQKAAFSPQGIAEKEYQAVWRVYKQLEEKLRQEKGKGWKWLFDIWE